MLPAISFRGGEKETARLLLQSSVRLFISMYDRPTVWRGEIKIELAGTRKVYEAFSSDTTERQELWNAFSAVKPHDFFMTDIIVRVQTVTAVDKDWRQQLEAEYVG